MTRQEAIDKVAAIAKAEVGYMEKNKGQNLYTHTPGGDGNYTKYWADLKPSYQGSAWCNAWCMWILYKAFGKEIAKKMTYIPNGQDFSYYTPTTAGWFKANKAFDMNPLVGDFIYFKNSTRICHIEWVYRVTTTTIYTYGGNTSPGDGKVYPNGGMVCMKSYPRSLSRIAGYGHINWDLVADSTPIDTNIKMDIIKSGVEGLKLTANLNIRKAPKDGEVVRTAVAGFKVKPLGKTYVDGEPWIKIDGGWISGKYVEGWIQEPNNKWWYVNAGWKYTTNGSQTIDGETYYFDKDGYMRSNELMEIKGVMMYLKSSGTVAKKEWVELKNTWYYAKENGELARNEFIFIESPAYGKELYCFDNDYRMVTGTITLTSNSRGALILK